PTRPIATRAAAAAAVAASARRRGASESAVIAADDAVRLARVESVGRRTRRADLGAPPDDRRSSGRPVPARPAGRPAGGWRRRSAAATLGGVLPLPVLATAASLLPAGFGQFGSGAAGGTVWQGTIPDADCPRRR